MVKAIFKVLKQETATQAIYLIFIHDFELDE